MMIYNPISRSKIEVNPRDFVIYDNWGQVKDLVEEEVEENEDRCDCPKCQDDREV